MELTDKQYALLSEVYHEMFDTVFVFLPEDILNAYYKRLYSK